MSWICDRVLEVFYGLWFEGVFGVDVLWILQDYPIFCMQLERTGLANLGGPFCPMILFFLIFFKLLAVYFTIYVFHSLGLDCYSQTSDGENLTVYYRKNVWRVKDLDSIHFQQRDINQKKYISP